MNDNIPKVNLPQNDEYLGVGGFVLEMIKIVALAFLIIVPIRIFLFQPFFVQGASMEPNFEDGEYLIVNELGYKRTEIGLNGHYLFIVKPFKKIDREEVVVFRYPLDASKFFIKRVIGLPGERIMIKDNQITVFNAEYPQGLVLDEKDYLNKNVRTQGDLIVTLKNDEYFVMGDNRTASSDSRAWGPVNEKYIMGKVLLRAWPPSRLDTF